MQLYLFKESETKRKAREFIERIYVKRKVKKYATKQEIEIGEKMQELYARIMKLYMENTPYPYSIEVYKLKNRIIGLVNGAGYAAVLKEHTLKLLYLEPDDILAIVPDRIAKFIKGES